MRFWRLRSLRERVPQVSVLPHLSNTGMEPQPAWGLQIPLSPIANTPTTSCSGRTGKVHPNQRRIFNGRATAGIPCARFWWKARMATTSQTKEIRLRAQPTDQTSTAWRSEEHTSELQSQSNLVCRLLLEKKKKAR